MKRRWSLRVCWDESHNIGPWIPCHTSCLQALRCPLGEKKRSDNKSQTTNDVEQEDPGDVDQDWDNLAADLQDLLDDTLKGDENGVWEGDDAWEGDENDAWEGDENDAWMDEADCASIV